MRLLPSVLLLLLLASCGFKGPLYLPQDQKVQSEQKKSGDNGNLPPQKEKHE